MVGGLVDGQPTEETQLDDRGLLWIEFRQPAERLVEDEQVAYAPTTPARASSSSIVTSELP